MRRLKPVIKTLIAIIAVLNIVVMMLFEYRLSSLVLSAETGESNAFDTSQSFQDELQDVGTIEAVEKEKSNKESEEANIALAKGEDAKDKEDEPEEERDPDEPLLELTDDHIYLKVGDRFNYMSYIKTMEDVDGSDLSHYIHLDGDVDTWEPGEVELTYRITSTITGKSSSKKLHITIIE